MTIDAPLGDVEEELRRLQSVLRQALEEGRGSSEVEDGFVGGVRPVRW